VQFTLFITAVYIVTAFEKKRCTSLCPFYTERKSFPRFQCYGGEMPATLEDSLATDNVA